MIDTHAHLNLDAFSEDYKEVIATSFKKEISIINIGINYKTSLRAVEISKKYSKVYASVGLHPLYVEKEKYIYQEYFNLVKSSKKIIAIGEIGLDYYQKREIETEKKQKNILSKQLSLAKELNLPVIFHCRRAHKELIEVLKSEIRNPKSATNPKSQIQNSKIRGVVHCFTGNWEQAKQYLEMGLFLGFNGIIFKMNLNQVIKNIPIDKILFETDCPYLTPLNLGNIRNEPQFMIETIKGVAEIKNINIKDLIKKTDENSKKLFKLDWRTE